MMLLLLLSGADGAARRAAKALVGNATNIEMSSPRVSLPPISPLPSHFFFLSLAPLRCLDFCRASSVANSLAAIASTADNDVDKGDEEGENDGEAGGCTPQAGSLIAQ